MKLKPALLLACMLIFGGCSSAEQAASSSQQEAGDSSALEIQVDSSRQNESGTDASKTVIVSYSHPVTGMGDSDTNTSASVVIENGQLEGNTEYVASVLAEETGAEWIRLETVEQYPVDYQTLVDQAKEEQNDNFRPDLKEVPDLSDYDQVILVTPNWWADLPMPVYTFLESEDWQNRQIVPVVVHGGSGFSDILDTLSEYASVDQDHALSLSRSSLMEQEDTIREWTKDL